MQYRSLHPTLIEATAVSDDNNNNNNNNNNNKINAASKCECSMQCAV